MTKYLGHFSQKSGKRSIIGLLILYLFLLASCDSYEVVVDELLQKDANEVLVLLRDKKIEARKEGHTSRKSVTYQIKVKKSQAVEALRILVYNHLPKIDRVGLKEVYPPGSSGIIPTKSDELARLTMAMQGEIEALLKVVPGIADAHVVFSYEPFVEYNKEPKKRTASVTLIYRPVLGSTEPPLSEIEVKSLIAASISGLLADDVTVVQKMIKPVDFVDGRQEIKEALPTTKALEAEPKKTSQWYLMALTIIAVITAAYGACRVLLQRRIEPT